MGTVVVLLVTVWCLAEVISEGPNAVPFAPPAELATLSPGAVVNVPLSVHDSFAMLLQVFHGRPIATGYLSRITAAQAQHVGRLDALLRQEPAPFAEAVRALGIGNVIVSRGAPDDLVAGLRSTDLTVLDLRSVDRDD